MSIKVRMLIKVNLSIIKSVLSSHRYRHQDRIFTDEEGCILARKARGNLNRRNNKPTSKY